MHLKKGLKKLGKKGRDAAYKETHRKNVASALNILKSTVYYIARGPQQGDNIRAQTNADRPKLTEEGNSTIWVFYCAIH